MAKVTLESIMQFMLEHMATKEDIAAVRSEMATKKDLEHTEYVMQRKIEHSEINVKAEMCKQRLELEACIKDEVEGLAKSVREQVDSIEERFTLIGLPPTSTA